MKGIETNKFKPYAREQSKLSHMLSEGNRFFQKGNSCEGVADESEVHSSSERTKGGDDESWRSSTSSLRHAMLRRHSRGSEGKKKVMPAHV